MKTTPWVLLLGLLVGACVPRMMRSVSFLNDDIPYRADPHDKNVMIYRNPDLRVTSYSKFLIDPVNIFSNESIALKPEEEATLADNFREELAGVLKPDYEIADHPGPGVLRIRIAIQDIQPAKSGFVEDGAVVLRLDTLLARVAMELDCVDSLSDVRVVALIHTLRDTRYFQKEKKTRLVNIQDAFRIWAVSLRKRFDHSKALSNTGFGAPDSEENRRLKFEEGSQ